MSQANHSDDSEPVRQWLRLRRQSGLSPTPAMETWFLELAEFCRCFPLFLDRVRRDGAVELDPGRDTHTFLRIDLFFPLVIMLGSRGRRSGSAQDLGRPEELYGWTAALDEFTDPVWRSRSVGDVERWGEVLSLGILCGELAGTLRTLDRAFLAMEDWEAVGGLLRRAFLQSCALLIRLEIDIARMEDLESQG